MYAVVKTGGKQYKVTAGDSLRVERIEGAAGDKVELKEVLSVGGSKPLIGAPLVKDASVKAEIIEQDRDDKVIVFKKKRRHNYRRKLGHRQQKTVLFISEITAGGETVKAKTAAPKAKKAVAEPKKTAAKKTAEAKKPADKKAPAKKAASTEKKPAAKKPAAKKAPAKKPVAKKDDK